MAKRSSNVRHSYVAVEEEKVIEEVQTVRVVNLIDATVKIKGTVSGKLYVFSGAGSEVDIDKEDVSEILNKKVGGCCGGSASSIFQLVK